MCIVQIGIRSQLHAVSVFIEFGSRPRIYIHNLGNTVNLELDVRLAGLGKIKLLYLAAPISSQILISDCIFLSQIDGEYPIQSSDSEGVPDKRLHRCEFKRFLFFFLLF
jgi:hypothetical protein